MSKLNFPSPWIGAVPTAGAKCRLLCLPFPGGAASVYLPWADALPPGVQLCVAQLPGREDRFLEPPLTRFDEVVDRLVTAVLAEVEPPFAIFGHSGGALLGYEVARTLRRRAEAEPTHLFVSGQPAPDVDRTEPDMHRLPDAELIDALRAIGGTAPELLDHPEMLELLLPVLRADFAWYETYQYRPGDQLSCEVTALASRSDVRASVDSVQQWRSRTTGTFRLRLVDGGHFFVRDARAAILREISVDLGWAPQAEAAREPEAARER
jgi:medium-chain acyl-[acyl-carrier-protein] hydrolase